MHHTLRSAALAVAVTLAAILAPALVAPQPVLAQADAGPVVRMEPIPDRPAPPPQPPAQQAFATPEAVIAAMIAAMREPGFEALTRVLGPRVAAAVPPGERRSVEVRRSMADQLSRMPFTISYLDAQQSRASVLFGPDRNPLPATLVRTGRGWVVDQAATIEAMRERRIGVNEANAIRALQALAGAQNAFRRQDSVGDGVLQFAQRIASSPGRSDGLVPSPQGALPGAAIGLNEAFARAEGRPNDPNFRPVGGYGYRILTAQGKAAEGGEKSYLRDGRLTEGYAVVAWPVRPGETGLSTFIMDWRGKVFEREFGTDTVAAVSRMSAFDPAPGWQPVEPTER